MNITELETLLVNTEGIEDIAQFKLRPNVENSGSLPAGEKGDVVQVNDTGHYYLYDDSWKDIGGVEDSRMSQMQEDINNLKLSTGQPVDLSDYLRKDGIEEVFNALTSEEIDNILNGGA